MRGPGRPPASSGGLEMSYPASKGPRYGQTRCHLCRRATVSPAGADIEAGSLAPNNHEHQRAVTPRPALSRAEEVVLHRLRLGYEPWKELRDGFEERPCQHCPHMTPHPLIHYLPFSRPATERLRQRVGPESEGPPRMAVPEKFAPAAGGGACRPTPPMNTKERE
ncbi:hypothetical protein GWK47_021668 [Chionoecetes opilio]|uniref:Uncharacterized protein n=1 Tax=Chionoecetes opilio TaxID=41210 RepID=A0A8J4XXH3_CHIOP|nr:hypothetical protein GWK47_021668 [Chionoecetes opilio]